MTVLFFPKEQDRFTVKLLVVRFGLGCTCWFFAVILHLRKIKQQIVSSSSTTESGEHFNPNKGTA